MPEFANPFPGVVPREMTDSELVRAIMLNIAAEYEAVHLYLAHMDATSNEDAKKVLYDIALEELVHVGEFTSLLFRLDATSGTKTQEGFTEVQELLRSKSPYDVEPVSENPTPEEPVVPTPTGFTVGKLKES
ncbi:MAG TPA: Rubrerythrin [Armatimonadota bacterium]|nr:Rubrerythrin [Armatimonadota bacterium]